MWDEWSEERQHCFCAISCLSLKGRVSVPRYGTIQCFGSSIKFETLEWKGYHTIGWTSQTIPLTLKSIELLHGNLSEKRLPGLLPRLLPYRAPVILHREGNLYPRGAARLLENGPPEGSRQTNVGKLARIFYIIVLLVCSVTRFYAWWASSPCFWTSNMADFGKGGVTLVNLQRQLATSIRNACFSHEFSDMIHFWIAFKNFQRVAALQISQKIVRNGVLH